MGGDGRAVGALAAGAISAAVVAFITDVVVAIAPWRLAGPDSPLRLADLSLAGPRGLEATVLGLLSGAIVALLVVAAVDRPAVRRLLGVLIGALTLAALVVTVVQERAVGGGLERALDPAVGLAAAVLVAVVMVIWSREPVSLPARLAFRLFAVLIPVLMILALGHEALLGA